MGLILPAQAEIVLFWALTMWRFTTTHIPHHRDKHPRALGRPARESWSELWSDLEPLLRRVRETGETVSAKDRPFYIERHGLGETVYFDISYSPVREADGSVGGVLCIVSETTVRVQAQRQLASERERLAQLFQQAPSFMAVLGSLELLRKRIPDDPALVRLIDNAMEGARRGSSLTRRMLAFARRQDLKTEDIDLAGLVDGMTDLLQRSLGPTVTVRTDFPPQLPRVETDPNQLESALLNLAVNARDAMQGRGQIKISARLGETSTPAKGLEPGSYVCLSVADTGEGMDEETLKRAAEPFFTTKGIGKGTGLGLSMVHGLAEQSGGALALRSRKGEGTVAEIWLPVARWPSSGDEASAAAADAPPGPVGPLHILAIDDDPLVLMNTVDLLEDMGHTVTAVASADEALKLLRQGALFDLAISDHAMPGMTGSEFARVAMGEHPDLKIVLATGYAELPTGSDIGLPRLAKPFNQSELAAAIAQLLHH